MLDLRSESCYGMWGKGRRTIEEARRHRDLKSRCVYVSLGTEVTNKGPQEHGL